MGVINYIISTGEGFTQVIVIMEKLSFKQVIKELEARKEDVIILKL